MISIENLDFLREEVLVTRPKQEQSSEKEVNVFAEKVLPQDKSGLVVVEVVKTGKQQKDVKVGDRLLVSEQNLKETIYIQNQGTLDNVFKIMSSLGIYAVVR